MPHIIDRVIQNVQLCPGHHVITSQGDESLPQGCFLSRQQQRNRQCQPQKHEVSEGLRAQEATESRGVDDTKSLDMWVAVFKKANSYVKRKRPNHNIPTFSHQGSPDGQTGEYSGQLRDLSRFWKSFYHVGRHRDGDLTIGGVLDGYEDMGARIGQPELRSRLKGKIMRTDSMQGF
jgi:hypothetical protein